MSGPIKFNVATGERPVTLNRERNRSHFARAATSKAWKTATAEALLEHRLTRHRFERVAIRLRPFYPTNAGVLPDTGGIQPTEKAIIDALVDAELIPDDNRWHVQSITAEAPELGHVDHPLVVVQVEPVDRAEPHPPRSDCGCRPSRRARP